MKNHLFYQLSVLPLLILMFCSCQQEEKEPVVVQEYVCSQEPNSYLHQLSYDLEYSNEEEDGLIYKNVSDLVKDNVDVFELTFWTGYEFSNELALHNIIINCLFLPKSDNLDFGARLETGYYPLKTQSFTSKNLFPYSIYRDDRSSSWYIQASVLRNNKWESDYEVIILGEMHVKSFGYRDYDITLRMVAQSGLTVMYHFKTEDDKVIVDEDK